jgi:hypothetical protein
MRKMLLVLTAMAICVMMAAPMAGAKSAAQKDYSTMTGDFVTGPSVGAWGNGWTVCEYSGQKAPQGGPVTIWDPPTDSGLWGVKTIDGTNTHYISSTTHGELIIMFKKLGGPYYLDPLALASGTYYCPGDKIKDMHFVMHMDKWGADGKVNLAVHMDATAFPAGTTVKVVVDNDHITISGSQIDFHYDDWQKLIDWNHPLFGKANHDFTVVIDK